MYAPSTLRLPAVHRRRQEVSVSGSLCPFDEDVAVAFRGPMNIHNIVWFEGSTDSLSRTSKWTPKCVLNSNHHETAVDVIVLLSLYLVEHLSYI